MTKKLIIFLSGMFILCAAWMGVTSSVETAQKEARQESSPIKFNLLQSRWSRLSQFQPLGEEGVSSPAVFYFSFEGLDLNLESSDVSDGMRSDLYLDVKKAYLDSGRDSTFFALDMSSEGEGEYLVRVQKSVDKTAFVGFPQDMVLNFMSRGLSNEWYLLDGKNRVLSSSEFSYVGRSLTLGKIYELHSFEVDERTYKIAMLKPKTGSLAMTNFVGCVGIALVMLALFLYTGGDRQRAVEAHETRSSSLHTEEVVSGGGQPEKVKKHQEQEDELFDDVDDDVRMVDLSQKRETPAFRQPTSKENSLDYSDFLMDNPVLGGDSADRGHVEEKPTASSNTVKSKTPKDQDFDLSQASQPDDWVKLAEELSESIDEFTRNLEKEKSSQSSKI
jgi:hypothetical protein